MKRRVGEDLVEIFVDHGGFINHLAIMDDGRHHPVGVERQIIGMMLVAGPQIEMMRREILTFFGEGEPHLLRTGGHAVMIKLDHPISSPSPLHTLALQTIIRER